MREEEGRTVCCGENIRQASAVVGREEVSSCLQVFDQ